MVLNYGMIKIKHNTSVDTPEAKRPLQRRWVGHRRRIKCDIKINLILKRGWDVPGADETVLSCDVNWTGSLMSAFRRNTITSYLTMKLEIVFSSETAVSTNNNFNHPFFTKVRVEQSTKYVLK
jgi:hypothetical protein